MKPRSSPWCFPQTLTMILTFWPSTPLPRRLTLSDIPFHGPVGAVRIGLVNDQMIVNPTYAEMAESKLNIMVVGTAEGIVMVESGAKEVSKKRSGSH